VSRGVEVIGALRTRARAALLALAGEGWTVGDANRPFTPDPAKPHAIDSPVGGVQTAAELGAAPVIEYREQWQLLLRAPKGDGYAVLRRAADAVAMAVRGDRTTPPTLEDGVTPITILDVSVRPLRESPDRAWAEMPIVVLYQILASPS